MLPRAALDLDRDMREPAQPRKPSLVLCRRTGIVGDERDDRGEMAGADAPKVQIGNPVAFLLEPRGDQPAKAGIGADIQEDRAGRAQDRR